MTNTTHTSTDLPTTPKPANSTGVPADSFIHHFTDGRFTTWVSTSEAAPDAMAFWVAEMDLEDRASAARRGGPEAEASFYDAVEQCPFDDFSFASGPMSKFVWDLVEVIGDTLLDAWHGDGTAAMVEHGMVQADMDWADR